VAKQSSTYDVTHKKTVSTKQKIFFECRLEDLPRLLTLRPGPYPEQKRRYSRVKPRAFRRFFSEIPRKQLDAKEFTMKKIGWCTKWCDHHGSDLWTSTLSENCCYGQQNLVYFT